MTPPGKYEASILIRVDNMGTMETEAQLALRFPVDVDNVPPADTLEEAVRGLVAAALEQAPPVAEWTTSGFPR